MINFTKWEPKFKSRFIAKLYNDNVQVLSCYTIKKLTRPAILNGEKVNCITLYLYEPLGENVLNKLFNMSNYSDLVLEVNELSPTGEVVESWTLKNCLINHLRGADLDWTDNDNPAEVELSLSFKTLIINDTESL